MQLHEQHRARIATQWKAVNQSITDLIDALAKERGAWWCRCDECRVTSRYLLIGYPAFIRQGRLHGQIIFPKDLVPPFVLVVAGTLGERLRVLCAACASPSLR